MSSISRRPRQVYKKCFRLNLFPKQKQCLDLSAYSYASQCLNQFEACFVLILSQSYDKTVEKHFC